MTVPRRALRVLAVDVGGTNSRFGCFEVSPPDRDTGWSAAPKLVTNEPVWLKTAEHAGFVELLEAFAALDPPVPPGEADACVFAVPGAVRRGGSYCKPPNVAYAIDLDDARRRLDLGRSTLVNDFAAQAWAMVSPSGRAARLIHPRSEGVPDPDAPMAVIGAGTGLGMAGLVRLAGGARAHAVQGRWLAVPSEGGHMSFPFQGAEEREYQAWLEAKTGLGVLYGDVILSGGGLARLHEFLTGQVLTPEALTPLLTPDSRTVEWFARLYGRAGRNLVVAMAAWNGLHVAGGVAARTPALVEHPAFSQEFENSPVYREALSKTSIRLNQDQNAGLWGAAELAARIAVQAFSPSGEAGEPAGETGGVAGCHPE